MNWTVMVLFWRDGLRETDGRKLTQAEQEAQRLQAARLLRAGRKPEEVAEALRRSRAWAFEVQKALRKGGEGALAAVPRPEGPKKLNWGQRAELAVLIEDHAPHPLPIRWELPIRWDRTVNHHRGLDTRKDPRARLHLIRYGSRSDDP